MCLLLIGMSVHAEDFEAIIDGHPFHFNVRDAVKHTVELTQDPNHYHYSGTIIIPETVVNPNNGIAYTIDYLKGSAFEGETDITRLEFSDALKDLGQDVFKNCTGLKTVVFGANLEHLWKRSFLGCSSLETLVFGKSDKFFQKRRYTDDGPLGGIPHVDAVYCTDPDPKDVAMTDISDHGEVTPGEEPFDVIGKTATLYVPLGTADAYKTKMGWRQFENIQEYILLDENKELKLTVPVTGKRVVFQRTLKKDRWNSYCAPLNLDATEIANVFGAGTEVLEYDPSSTKSTLKFRHVTEIKANVPYMLKVTKEWDGHTYMWPAHDVEKPEAVTATGGAFTFTGSYMPGNVPQGSYFLSGSKYYKAKTSTSNPILGYRTYLSYLGNSSSAPAAPFFQFMVMPLSLGGMPTTEVISLVDEQGEQDGDVYNLQGQMVCKAGQSRESLPQGVYVVNGKKILINGK